VSSPNPERVAPSGPAPAGISAADQVWWLWAVGALVGLVVIGPGLRPGSLLNLDLLVTPRIPVPNGVFGLGPALSQRVPSFAVLGVGSWFVGGPFITKLALLAMVAAAFAGAARLTGPTAALGTRLAAGVLWAAGPFAVTRIGVGHLNVVWAIAVLPWVFPRLCRPSEDPWSTFLATGLLAFGGPASGTLGVAVAGVSLLVERKRRPVAVVVAAGFANLVWIAPTAVLLWAGASVAGAGSFETHTGGVAGWPAVLVGNGFWRADEQVGAVGGWGAVAAVCVLALAVLGRRRLDPRWARPGTYVAITGLVLTLATAVPGVSDAYRWLSDLPVGAPLRESQRFLALWLVVAAPAAALGGEELARRLIRAPKPAVAGPTGVVADGAGRAIATAPEPRRWASGARALVLAVPLALAVAVSMPGWWGAGGRLEPRKFPHEWSVARARIEREPGTVVNFPWAEYNPWTFAGNRQVFNPVPDVLGGDVISSYDPLFDMSRPSQEQVDRRADVVDHLSRRARSGHLIGTQLARLGVRWVFLAHERNYDTYATLQHDPALRKVFAGRAVDLFAVRGWRGPVTDPSGGRHSLSRPLAPVLVTHAPKGSVVDVAGAPGWIQGWSSPARVTSDGRLQLTGTGHIVWFWPGAALVLLDLALLGAVILAMRKRHARWSETNQPGQILAPAPPGR
jgi:hypothetical protein